MRSIKDALKEYNFEVTHSHVRAFMKIVQEFEASPDRAKVLGTAVLAVDKMYFYTSDAQKLFDLFNVDKTDFANAAYDGTIVDPKQAKVSSDPFYLFAAWVAHRAHVSKKLSPTERTEFITKLYLYIGYRMFTSAVYNKFFPQGVNAEVMQYTVDNLSMRSAIKHSGSWYIELVNMAAETRNRKANDEGLDFAKVEKAAGPDVSFLRLITYHSNNIRKRIRRIAEAYYDNMDNGVDVRTDSSIQDINGTISMRAIESAVPEMVAGVVGAAPNKQEWIDYEAIGLTYKMSKGTTESGIINMLNKFCGMADYQRSTGHGDETQGKGAKRIYKGYKILLTELIQKVYRQCILDPDCDVTSKRDIITKTRSMFTSSRISDEDILILKQSTHRLVTELTGARREATVTAFRQAFVVYVMLQSFRHAK